MKTSVNEMDAEVMTKSLAWVHEDSNNQEVSASRDSSVVFPDFNHTDTNSTDEIKKFFDDGLKCRVYGSIDVTKVTGQLAFRLKGTSLAF